MVIDKAHFAMYIHFLLVEHVLRGKGERYYMLCLFNLPSCWLFYGNKVLFLEGVKVNCSIKSLNSIKY